MRRWLLAAALLSVAAGVLGDAAPPARAATEPAHRAVVVVDTGAEVRKVCIRFDADSLSGTEALELAGVDPVFAGYGDELGAAVCSLCGVGCDAGDCFCGRDTWWYHRAPAGSSSYTQSGLGASSTRVENGDVEGWSFGTGAAPPGADIDTVCGEVVVDPGPPPSPPTTAATVAPDTAVPPPTIVLGDGDGGGDGDKREVPIPTSTTAPPGAAPTTTPLPSTTTSTVVGPEGVGPARRPTTTVRSATVGGDQLASRRPADDRPGRSPAGAVLAGAALLAAGVATWRIRVRRGRTA